MNKASFDLSPELEKTLTTNTKSQRTFADVYDQRRLTIEQVLDTVLCGDCSDWLDRLPDCSLDLIYIDPPFFSRTEYEVIWGNGWEKAAWEDWQNSTKGDIDSFVTYMGLRIQKMKDKLKSTASIWVHCDHRANYRFRSVLEEVFGGNFVTEIIVQTTYSGRDQSNEVGKQHETILVFSKEKSYYLNNKYETDRVPKSYKNHDELGLWASSDLTQSGTGESRIFDKKELTPPPGKHWIWPQERINQAVLNGKINCRDINKDFIFFTNNGVPRIKRYWKSTGKIQTLTSLWTDCIKNSWTEDNSGSYPTRKGLALLERIITAGCPEKGVVGDFFCGGGTTLIAAKKLNRRFIGCDVSPVAIKALSRRFVLNEYNAPRVLGFPKSKKTYLALDNPQDKHVFERFLCKLCGWSWLDGQSGRGFTFNASAFNDTIGIQIKNCKSAAGVKEVRELSGALNQSSYKKSILVAWDLSATGHAELQKAKKSKNIDFVKIDYFLDCFLISEEEEKEIDLLFN